MRNRVFLIDDDELIVSMLSRVLRKEGYEVLAEVSAKDIMDKIISSSPDVILLDLNLPGGSGIDILQEVKMRSAEAQVVVLTADNTVETAVKAMKLGAADYLTKPFQIDEVKLVISNAIERKNLRQEVIYLRRTFSEIFYRDIIGNSDAIKELKETAEKIAKAQVPTVLITGESGTGKEVFARYIHHVMHGTLSENENKKWVPFIAVNCASLPETLVESELFGYEKGAFTDAKSVKKGIFEVADTSTVLLDEIGDMKLELQSKLLRVIEEKTVRRIGGTVDIPVNVTVIATTNKDLALLVEKGEFRKDIFHRLNAFRLHLPPLRERREDIPLLVEYYLQYFTEKYKKKSVRKIFPNGERLLISYNWPGNIRELRNVIERLVVLGTDSVIKSSDLPKEIAQYDSEPSHHLPDVSEPLNPGMFILSDSGISIDGVIKDLMKQAMMKANRNKALAARLLHMSYDSFRYKLKKFRIGG